MKTLNSLMFIVLMLMGIALLSNCSKKDKNNENQQAQNNGQPNHNPGYNQPPPASNPTNPYGNSGNAYNNYADRPVAVEFSRGRTLCLNDKNREVACGDFVTRVSQQGWDVNANVVYMYCWVQSNGGYYYGSNNGYYNHNSDPYANAPIQCNYGSGNNSGVYY